jgi:hypothetical protein
VPSVICDGLVLAALRLMLVVVGCHLMAMALYQQHTDAHGADLAYADQVFWLKYFLSSQSAILWMSVLFFMSTDLLLDWHAGAQATATMSLLGSRLTWAGSSWR